MPLTDDADYCASLERAAHVLESHCRLLLSDNCTSEDRTRIRRAMGLIPEGDADREDRPMRQTRRLIALWESMSLSGECGPYDDDLLHILEDDHHIPLIDVSPAPTVRPEESR